MIAKTHRAEPMGFCFELFQKLYDAKQRDFLVLFLKCIYDSQHTAEEHGNPDNPEENPNNRNEAQNPQHHKRQMHHQCLVLMKY